MNPLIIIRLFVLGLVLTGSLQAAGTGDYDKRISKTFPLKNSGQLKLDNRYGTIRVETWDREEVKIDVRIVAEADDQEAADKIFDRISIDFSQFGGAVEAITRIGEKKKEDKGFFESIFGSSVVINFGSNGGGNDFKIHYVVQMPAAAKLTTEAKYCDVELADLTGDTELTVGYGDLVTGDLAGRNRVQVSYGTIRMNSFGDNSYLRLRYTEGNLDRATFLEYDGRYSELEMDYVKEIKINAGYDEIDIEEAEIIDMDGNYNDVDLGKIGKLEYDGNYSDINVDEIVTEVEIDSGYGDVDIERLHKTFRRVYIRTRYADVDIDVDSGASYEVELRTRYGDISLDRDGGSLEKESVGSSESVVGTVGSGGSASVDISCSYGDINIY